MNRKAVHMLLMVLAVLFCMSGTTLAGWVTNADGSSSYQRSDGSFCRNERKKIGRYYYCFDAEGKLIKEQWVDNRYYKSNGRQAANMFVDGRYVGKNGTYVTGLKKVKGNVYYFDPATGYMVTDQTVTVSGKTYMLGADGTAVSAAKKVSGVEASYYTDPVVSDEELLAALIYCEAGNQPFDGQLAVGFVILNRVRSRQFPNTIKEVIYAKDQFTPSGGGLLTSVLKGKVSVTESAKKAAAQVIQMAAAGNYKVTNASGKQVSMKNYFFFMTPAAYRSLGLKSTARVLWDHVFFKTWA